MKSSIKVIVAFDPGLNLGWSAMNSERQLLTSGSLYNDTKIPIADRQNYLTNFITEYIETYDPYAVVVEEISRIRGRKINSEKNESTWALHWIYGEIIRLSSKLNKNLVYINPASMKSAVTKDKREPDAKGLASKEEVMKVVKDLYGHRKMKSDESDAIGLALTYWMVHDGEYVVGKSRKRKKERRQDGVYFCK